MVGLDIVIEEKFVASDQLSAVLIRYFIEAHFSGLLYWLIREMQGESDVFLWEDEFWTLVRDAEYLWSAGYEMLV